MKEYVIRVSYEGYITVRAQNVDNATVKAKEIWGNEVGFDISRLSSYEIEGIGE